MKFCVILPQEFVLIFQFSQFNIQLMGDYFAMNMNGKIPKVCAAGKYKLIGSNTFSENKTVYE